MQKDVGLGVALCSTLAFSGVCRVTVAALAHGDTLASLGRR